jgi:DNA methylase
MKMNTAELLTVTKGRSKFSIQHTSAETLLPWVVENGKKADLILGSPPYLDSRTYGSHGIARLVSEWVEWMYGITKLACEASNGLVVWVMAGNIRKHCYQPAPEGLIWKWFERGNHLWRPTIWRKNGLPGTGGKQKLRNDWEYMAIFTNCETNLLWANNLAMAKPPVYGPGGAMSYRTQSGARVNKKDYKPPKLANPGNVIYAPVGGGRIGDKEAHKSDAPYPEYLCEFWIKSYCKPGGLVVDPFMGSGTTAKVAVQFGRRCLGCDILKKEVIKANRRVQKFIDTEQVKNMKMKV